MGTSGPGLIREAGSARQVPSPKRADENRDRNARFPGPLSLWKLSGSKDMPRYFFHVRDATAKSAAIPRARNCPIWKRREAEAISANREMLGERLLHGGSLNHRQIEIADEQRHGAGKDQTPTMCCSATARSQLFRRRDQIGPDSVIARSAGKNRGRGIDKGGERDRVLRPGSSAAISQRKSSSPAARPVGFRRRATPSGWE